MTPLRDRTAAELAKILTDTGLDNPWSDSASTTRTLYAPDGVLYEASRLRFQGQLVAAHRAAAPTPHVDGTLVVVVTAGPPGAGKSTALARMPQLAGFRHIDADSFKDPLLQQAHADGLLSSWTDRMLADGRPMALRELSAFVHAESTAVADALRRQTLRDGENVVIHGTLSSTDYLSELLAELDDAGYDRLLIVDVEVPLATALEQAIARWWQVRDAQSDPLGGRFVPAGAIRSYYPKGAAEPMCSANAEILRTRAAALGWNVTLERA